MIAIISDIHGNLEALEAVLADIAQCGAEQTYCLGDIVGYGPNPCECLDIVATRCSKSILGDHEAALWSEYPAARSEALAEVAERTRGQLEHGPGGADARWEFLWSLRPSFKERGMLFVHGSPREPTHEYVFPEDCYNTRKLDAIFDNIEWLCFSGHTHLPGVFPYLDGFLRPEELAFEYELGELKSIVNVGSVGQPRDGDLRACYVLLDDRRVWFRRVEYDWKKTQRKL
ncbi:MAG TPA: metallophosphoesterase family protein [Pirellulaceae bacterium]|nr:metallophosphoesterase family protein [Pirellulaceae bacterium]